MPEIVMSIDCPHCEKPSLIAVPIDRMYRVDPKYQSYNIIGQSCECKNSRGLTLAHIHIDENGIGEALYEYAKSGYSQKPVFDHFYGRFDEM